MQRGFTLVELSIVLVIIGLLTGGILMGQSLIRSSEIKSISTQYDGYRTAMQNFRNKYNGLPGDLKDATDYWGVADPTPATCAGTQVTSGTATCNGDGNGNLTNAVIAGYNESFRFWQQLANAGFIAGRYTGASADSLATGLSMNSTNAPTGKISQSIWSVFYDSSSGGALFPVALTRHNFRLGTVIVGTWNSGSVISPREAWNLDTKTDDGRPGTGLITVPMALAYSNCATTSAANTAEYANTLSDKTCPLYLSADD